MTEQSRALTPALRARIKRATVTLTGLGGRGILAAGTHILIAAHCVRWTTTGGMVLGEHYFEKVKTHDNREFRTSVYAVEPCRRHCRPGGA